MTIAAMDLKSKLLAAVVLFAALAAPPAPAQALPGFRTLPRASAEHQTYLEARVLAVGLVRRALPGMNGREARMGGRVLAALQRTRFVVSSDARSRTTCSTRHFSLFVNAYFRDTIFVCDEVRPHARRANPDALNRIAQGFVHEAVHLTGEMDECVATRFERAVMDRTIGVRSQGSQIRYGVQCRGAW